MKSSDIPSRPAVRVRAAQFISNVRSGAKSNFVNFLSGRTKSGDLLLLALLISFTAFLAACGGGSNSGGGGGGGGTPAISVVLTSPPTSVNVGATASFTAAVANDSSNGGVNWTCAPAGACGSFNPTTTASGAATTYTAPAAAPTGGTVTVTATSVTDSTKTASVSVAISSGGGGGGSTALAAGTYVLYATGLDSTKHLFGVVGEVQLDGNGNVTAGEQDYSNGNGLNSNGATPDTISAGTYTVNSSGQGTMTLPTSNTHLGVNGTETLSITVVNSKHVLVTEFDSSATASGSLDMQTLANTGLTQLVGGWSFEDIGENNHASYSQGGVYTLNAPSQAAICPTTTTPCSPLSKIVTDFDEIASGTRSIVIGNGNGSGYFSAPDGNGRGQAFFGGIYWDYYIVGPEVVRMLGYFPQTGTFDQIYLGSAYGQGANPVSASSFNGTFAFTNASTVLSTTYASAGLMTFDGSANVSGFADVSEGTATPTSGAVGGTYQMDIPVSFNNGTPTPVNGYGQIKITSGSTQGIATIGMYAVDPALNISDPNNTTSTGQGALLVDLDQTVNGDGVLLSQNSTSGVAAGNYGVGAQVFTATNGEVDLVGQAAANASAVFTGAVDVNDAVFAMGQTPAVPFSVTLTADGSHPGRFTAPLSLMLGGNAQPFNLVFYQVSGSQFVILVSGTGASGTGTIQSQ